MRRTFPYLIWLWICMVVVGAYLYAPLDEEFVGASSRILFFHIPMAWVSFVAFVAAAVWSLLYLLKRRPGHDHAALAAVQIGLVFGLLAALSGAMLARTMWGTFWNWDPRQVTIALTLLFYAAYLVLRDAITRPQTERRLAAVYAVLGFVIAPLLYFIAPRMATTTLHPEPILSARLLAIGVEAGEPKIQLDSRIFHLLLASFLGFTALFFWLHSIHVRVLAMAESRRSRAAE